jgi:hypothetical protein
VKETIEKTRQPSTSIFDMFTFTKVVNAGTNNSLIEAKLLTTNTALALNKRRNWRRVGTWKIAPSFLDLCPEYARREVNSGGHLVTFRAHIGDVAVVLLVVLV